MGLFKKKETTHFERDAEGQVIQVTRNGQDVDADELKMKSTRQLEQEYYKKHPEKKHPTMRKIGAGVSKLDKKVVNYNRRSNIMNPQRTGRSGPSFTFSSPGRGNANPFGSMFDTGQPRPKKKKQGKTKYAVVSGKAYPIAETGHKKTKKKSNKHRKKSIGFDPFDNSRWI
ncbi:unnamed protein product [marine sediment metagenome]|uniref:Uncharacterized protein n=1 Tax=marine sediment metagenome TaxID=412755 RepID=X1CQV5_9ZZZZ